MTIFLLLVGGLAVWGIVASILVVSRDGYRRQPLRPLAETWRDTSAVEARPSDLAVGQWLPERAANSAPGAQMNRTGHAAGVMVLRPW